MPSQRIACQNLCISETVTQPNRDNTRKFPPDNGKQMANPDGTLRSV
uniref:Uncharacterized protein n=1 Tax=Arundo donax TaxID=35708 RepID=A0A0A9HMW7_ARUDO